MSSSSSLPGAPLPPPSQAWAPRPPSFPAAPDGGNGRADFLPACPLPRAPLRDPPPHREAPGVPRRLFDHKWTSAMSVAFAPRRARKADGDVQDKYAVHASEMVSPRRRGQTIRSSPERAKSADRMDGAIFNIAIPPICVGRVVPGISMVPGRCSSAVFDTGNAGSPAFPGCAYRANLYYIPNCPRSREQIHNCLTERANHKI